MNNFVLILSVMTLIIVSMNPSVYASSYDENKSKIISGGDIYRVSKVPLPVSFDVKASDSNGMLPVQCDKISGSVFKVGKTTVRCMAITSFGDELRTSFVVTVGYDIVQIPNWLKHTTKLWTSSSISDNEYINTLEFLLEKDMIKVPFSKTPKAPSNTEIPIWIKSNSAKWSSNGLTNDEFSIGIQWMLERGVLYTQKGRV